MKNNHLNQARLPLMVVSALLGNTTSASVSNMILSETATHVTAFPPVDNSSSLYPDSFYILQITPPRRNFMARYKKIKETAWFKEQYVGKSLGDFIDVDE